MNIKKFLKKNNYIDKISFIYFYITFNLFFHKYISYKVKIFYFFLLLSNIHTIYKFIKFKIMKKSFINQTSLPKIKKSMEFNIKNRLNT
jgi:hypothetical protein